MTRTARLYLTLAAALAASSLASARPAPPPPATAAAASTVQAGRGGGPIRSPEIGAEGRVTFRYRAPGAEEVLVSVSGQRLPMQKDDEGVWSVTSEPLTPDIYTYAFGVDGASTTDPANRQVQTSFGSFQSLFMVPGPKPWLPAPNVPRGAIAKHTYHSGVAGDDRNFFVYTPADYNLLRTEAYPVLYLLHGLGDDAERWMEGGGGAHHIFDNLIAQGSARQMVVVTTLGYGTSRGPAGGRTAENITGFERALLDEVMPAVERSYHVSRDRESRAIAGLSMGGAETLYVGLRNLDRFAWIGAFSSAPQLFPAAIAATPPTPAGRGAGRGRGRGAARAMDDSVFAQTFPNLSASDNSRIRPPSISWRP